MTMHPTTRCVQHTQHTSSWCLLYEASLWCISFGRWATFGCSQSEILLTWLLLCQLRSGAVVTSYCVFVPSAHRVRTSCPGVETASALWALTVWALCGRADLLRTVCRNVLPATHVELRPHRLLVLVKCEWVGKKLLLWVIIWWSRLSVPPLLPPFPVCLSGHCLKADITNTDELIPFSLPDNSSDTWLFSVGWYREPIRHQGPIPIWINIYNSVHNLIPLWTWTNRHGDWMPQNFYYLLHCMEIVDK